MKTEANLNKRLVDMTLAFDLIESVDIRNDIHPFLLLYLQKYYSKFGQCIDRRQCLELK